MKLKTGCLSTGYYVTVYDKISGNWVPMRDVFSQLKKARELAEFHKQKGYIVEIDYMEGGVWKKTVEKLHGFSNKEL